MSPPGVEFFATRLRLRGGSREELLGMADAVEDAASLLADIEPSLIMFHCTAASVVGGVGYDQQLIARIERATGRPAGATASAIVLALRALDVTRVALISPYHAPTNAMEATFLEGHGFQVVDNVALGIETASGYVRMEPDQWLQAVRAMDLSQAQAVFVSCTNVRVIEAIDSIERAIGLPVVTSNQGSLWYVLRRLGIQDALTGYGRLLRECLELPQATAAAQAVPPRARGAAEA